jgi:hypothetical protein
MIRNSRLALVGPWIVCCIVAAAFLLLPGAFFVHAVAQARKLPQQSQPNRTLVLPMQYYGVSDTLSELARQNLSGVSKGNGMVQEDQMAKLFEEPEAKRNENVAPATIQTKATAPLAVVPGISFEGPGLGMAGFTIAGAPPDTTMAVGPNHIVAWVNTQYAVFNKSGTPLLPGNGFVNGNTLFAGMGNVCETTNRGDPILQYDRLADRWFLSQFAFNVNGSGIPIAPYLQCIAVSTTNNPLGSYFRYTISFSSTSPSGFNDYGKVGVWPDAYYTSYNMFGGSPAGSNTGAGLCASDRTKMLAGDATAATLCAPINFYGGGAGFLPADLDGTTLPTDTTQGGIFMRQSTAPALRILKLKANFAASTVTLTDGFGGALGSYVEIPLPTTTRACNGLAGACVAQPGTTTLLDTLGDRLMYRLAYRNRAGVDSLIVTQSVDPDGAGARSSAPRWYEIRSPFSATPTLLQNATYDPGASGDRWMGSIAMDQFGNMLLGYSVVNAGTGLKPSIAVAGRLLNDPVNTLQAESTIITGTGSQTGSLTRWGDYTTMQIDPADDATFWFIGQYLAADGSFNWHTRIASYKFPAASTLRIDSIAAPAGRASGGQQIVLTGAFPGLSTVTMGGVGAAFFYTNGAGDTSSITVTTPVHAVGAVQIDLTPTSGSPYSKANAFAYLPTVFTDDTLVVGTTTAKAQHIIELRQAVDAMRAVAGLGGAPWTDPALAAGNTIKAIHILDLRTYLDDAATRLGYSTSPYTDPALTTGYLIKRIHIEELRQRIRVIAG